MTLEHAAPGWKRRDLLKTAALGAAGYALAVQPVAASTIHTPDTGLAVADITVARAGAAIPVYAARPQGPGPFPGVVLIHEIFGLHEHIRDVARRLAQAGYYAVAPELYFREGGVQHLASIDAVLQVVRAVPDRQVLDDLGAVLEHVKSQPQCTGKAGATGFCWGGRATWLLAEDNPGLSAAVAWYGPLGDFGSRGLHPRSALEGAGDVRVPVLGLFGADDGGIPLSQVAKLRQALERGHKTFDIVVYPDTPHGFNADYRPSYTPQSALDGWQRMLAWFGKYVR